MMEIKSLALVECPFICDLILMTSLTIYQRVGKGIIPILSLNFPLWSLN